eukprot:1155033-Pelagomonas_calceolata.AAC.10
MVLGPPAQAAANAAPRGLYVCGKTSTGCGLTVSIAKVRACLPCAPYAHAAYVGDVAGCSARICRAKWTCHASHSDHHGGLVFQKPVVGLISVCNSVCDGSVFFQGQKESA